jgi:hypothetical protein
MTNIERFAEAVLAPGMPERGPMMRFSPAS